MGDRLTVSIAWPLASQFVIFNIGGSSNGRTAAFGAVYSGSNPGPPALFCKFEILAYTFNMGNLSGSIIYYALIGLLSSYLFLLFARFASKIFKPKSVPNLEGYDLQQLVNKYRTVTILSGTSFLWLAPLLIFLVTKVSYAIGGMYLEKFRVGSVFLIQYSIWAYIVPAIFLGMLLWAASTDLIMDIYKYAKKINDEEWDVYVYKLNRDSWGGKDIDNKTISIIATVFILCTTLPAFFLAINTYTRITPQSIYVNNYFSLTEKSYSYSDINKILFVDSFKNNQNGKVESTSSSYEVLFNNGDVWDTLNLSINKKPIEAEVVQYISSRSGKTPTRGIHNVDDIKN